MSDSYIDIVFDGPPSRESGRFVEVEDSTGVNINPGQWIHRLDGFWALRIYSLADITRQLCDHLEKAQDLQYIDKDNYGYCWETTGDRLGIVRDGELRVKLSTESENEKMKRWQILYQDTPYNFTQPASLLVKAETKVDAIITAIDHLTKNGHAVAGLASEGIITDLTHEEEDQLKSLWTRGRTRIRSIAEYTIEPKGRVLDGR